MKLTGSVVSRCASWRRGSAGEAAARHPGVRPAQRSPAGGIAAALHYRNADDPQAVELQQLLAELGPAQALARITGLAADSDIVSAIVTRYGNLK